MEQTARQKHKRCCLNPIQRGIPSRCTEISEWDWIGIQHCRNHKRGTPMVSRSSKHQGERQRSVHIRRVHHTYEKPSEDPLSRMDGERMQIPQGVDGRRLLGSDRRGE